MRLSVLTLAALAATGAAAHAAEQGIEVINHASRAVDAVAVRTGGGLWSANLLQQGTLAPGQAATVRFASEQPACSWEVRLTLAGGAQVSQPGLDLCKATQVEFYEDGADVAQLRAK